MAMIRTFGLTLVHFVAINPDFVTLQYQEQKCRPISESTQSDQHLVIRPL